MNKAKIKLLPDEEAISNGHILPHNLPHNARMTNGSGSLSSMRHHVASSPALAELGSGSAHHRNHNNWPPEDGASLRELEEKFRMIAQMPICVVRRVGSDVDNQISSIIKSACHATGNPPPPIEFLAVDQQCARRMLDSVHRPGLPLIFLRGDCVGGMAELKRLVRSGFVAESLGRHQFDMIIIGGGGAERVAEQAVEEAVRLGKRVALVELIGGTTTRLDSMGNAADIAKQMINQAAVMRSAIEEAREMGWTVESEDGARVSFGLDWRTVREGIARRARQRDERRDKLFEQGKVRRFAALACQFSGTHHITVCPEGAEEKGQVEGLVKLSADRFLMITKSEPKMLENVPGAKEFCTLNEQLFTLDHNPGRTLFFCEHDSDPAVLESAAILRALGNDVTIMSNTYASSKNALHPHHNLRSFDSELIEWIKDGLRQHGVRFIVSVPTKFEQLRAATEDKAAIVRVYAMSTWHGGTADKGTGDWTPFLEEFNTVVISVGRRSSQLARELSLDRIGIRTNSPAPYNDHRMDPLLLVPNLYAIGDPLLDDGATASEEGANCLRARMLMRRIWDGELLNPMDHDELLSSARVLLISPAEYACCGMSEAEAERKYGKEQIRVYRDEEVPMEWKRTEGGGGGRAKMICVREGEHQERVIGIHLIGPNAGQTLRGYGLAMQMGLGKWQMERSWQGPRE